MISIFNKIYPQVEQTGEKEQKTKKIKENNIKKIKKKKRILDKQTEQAYPISTAVLWQKQEAR